MKRLAVFLTIVIIGLGGYLGWHHWHTSPKSSSSNSSQKITDPSEGGKYLVIKEWGVRIPLTSDLRNDLSYGLRSGIGPDTANENTSFDAVSFASKKLEETPNNNCKIFKQSDGGENGGIGVQLIRTKDKLPENLPQYTKTNILHSAGYWFHSIPSKSSCTQGASEQTEVNISGSLVTALGGLIEVSK